MSCYGFWLILFDYDWCCLILIDSVWFRSVLTDVVRFRSILFGFDWCCLIWFMFGVVWLFLLWMSSNLLLFWLIFVDADLIRFGFDLLYLMLIDFVLYMTFVSKSDAGRTVVPTRIKIYEICMRILWKFYAENHTSRLPKQRSSFPETSLLLRTCMLLFPGGVLFLIEITKASSELILQLCVVLVRNIKKHNKYRQGLAEQQNLCRNNNNSVRMTTTITRNHKK